MLRQKLFSRIRAFLVCLLSLLFIGSTQTLAASENEYPYTVDTVLESDYIQLHLKADVQLPNPNEPLPIYTSDYAAIDDAKWKEFIFGSADADVIDENTDEEIPLYHREKGLTYSMGEVFVMYSAQDTRLFITYRDVEFVESWASASENTQVADIQTTPAEATDIAQAWVEQLSQEIGWDGFSLSGCYAMPSETWDDLQASGFYLVEFNRTLNHIPLAYDTLPTRGFVFSQARIEGDSLKVYIDDDGIFRVTGNYRTYKQTQAENLSISLDQAIEILRENMDYIYAGSESSPFVVSEIDLCYRLVQMHAPSDQDVLAQTEARPAWRFSSAQNRNQTDVFTVFIDACTGELLS